MIDDSLKETEALGKRIGNGLKSYIKEENNKYLPALKEKIAEGLKEYYDKLAENINNELYSQETQQKNLMDEIDNVKEETSKVQVSQQRQRELIEKFKIKKNEIYLKGKIFRFLVENMDEEKRQRKLESQLIYTRIYHMKKSIFDLLKKTTTFKTKKEFDQQIKTQTENELKAYEDTQIKEKEELLRLIFAAEEKLKHENRKKVQTKLLLDQIVLRGVSAMNLQALSLSNDALKDVYKTDYIKQIEKTFDSFNLPKTKNTLSSFQQNIPLK